MLILAAIDATWLRLILIVQTSKRLTPCRRSKAQGVKLFSQSAQLNWDEAG